MDYYYLHGIFIYKIVKEYIDDAEITEEERNNGINIKDITKE